MQAARGGNGLVCGCSRRIILEEFCILCKSFYVAGVEFLHVITRGNIQKWEAGVYSFRHKRNVYKKTKGYFFRCFTLISKRQSGFIFFPDKENTNVFLVLSFLGEAIKVQMYNFLPFRDQNTDGGDQCTLLLLHRANWCFPKQSSFQPALNSFTDPQNIAVYKCERFQFWSRFHFLAPIFSSGGRNLKCWCFSCNALEKFKWILWPSKWLWNFKELHNSVRMQMIAFEEQNFA